MTAMDIAARHQAAEQACREDDQHRVAELYGALDAEGQCSDEGLFLYAIALRHTGRPAEAVAVLERLVERQPGHTNAMAELAGLLADAGDRARAAGLLRTVIERVPAHSAGTRLLALLMEEARGLIARFAYAEAYPYVWEAAHINASYPQVLGALGLIQSNLRDYANGITNLRQSLALYPDDPVAMANLAATLEMVGEYAEAEALARRVVTELAPGMGTAWCSLGAALRSQGRFAEAIEALEKGLALDPDMVPGLANLATIHSLEGRFDQSLPLYEKSMELEAGRPATSAFLMACDLLRAGDWDRGWAVYEQRNQHFHYTLQWHKIDKLPPWTGDDPAGRRILVESEQGMGDSLHFFRYVRLLADRGAQVGLFTNAPLVRLFAISDPRIRLVTMDADPAEWECGISMMSLPHRFGVRPDNILCDPPYLAADPADSRAWARRLAGLPGLKVGLVWAGDPRPHDPISAVIDRRRSMALKSLSPLADIPGISFVSLQKGAGAAQLADPPFPIHDWTEELSDFADTAALASQLDLVVSVDTSTAHLAGGLDIPVLLLSRYDGCWRWMQAGDRTPWYPSMRLFRQQRWNDWTNVVTELEAALRERVAGKAGTGGKG
ncbi:tetratricopeptide repeat protein [Niveispirillum sp. KHB5.9]|uniref:tetratricopeptide repeat protein n=1 Tax=Niveispirillum sp. KHB5.9 TaxID=3400269 RepID=UPI003A885305